VYLLSYRIPKKSGENKNLNMSDSAFGTIETFMGDHEKLRAALCATRIGSALQIAILQHRDAIKTASTEESDRFEEYLNYTEEMNPMKNPNKAKAKGKGKGKSKTDADADTDATDATDTTDATDATDADADADDDDNAYKYCYYGKGKVKGDDGKLVEIEGNFPKKKFVTVATQVKHALQYALNCYVDEAYGFYKENKNSLPGDNLMDAITMYTLEQRDDPITPFVHKVSKLYPNINDLIEDENTKGTGKLVDFVDGAIKEVFDLKKASNKNVSNKVYDISSTFVNFIKTIAVFVMDFMWEQRTPFNLGMLYGIFRQLSRVISGAECPDTFYEYANMFIKENEGKKSASAKTEGTAAPAKGKGKGRGRPPSKSATAAESKKSTDAPAAPAKAASSSKGKGKGSTAAAPAPAPAKKTTKVSEALDAEADDQGDLVYDEFDDTPLPDEDN
jgi:hypothetical protein